MRATLMKETVKALFPQQRTLCIEGSPGGGKTTIVHEVADDLGVECRELHMPTMLVEDFGILYPDKEDSDNLTYRLPEWFPQEGKAPDKGILLFDDRNQAGADLQKVLANICQARTLHGHKLPDGWQVISTGNRQKDRAGANRVLSHLRNRETVVDLDTHLDDWSAWAIEHGVKTEVVSLIRFRPNLLHDFDPQREQNATPRSWVDGVSDVLGTVPPEAEYECFKGAVGEGAAAEFVGFIRIYRKLPNPDAILLNPTTASVPSDPATLYALSGAIAERATEDNFNRVCTYAERMPPEFSVLSISYAARKKPELASTKAFTDWAVKHQDILF
jgi:hypothetical protein